MSNTKHTPTLRDRIPEIVEELNELADGNYNPGSARPDLWCDCATLIVGLTTERNVQLALAAKREAELGAALRELADKTRALWLEASVEGESLTAAEIAVESAMIQARAALAKVQS